MGVLHGDHGRRPLRLGVRCGSGHEGTREIGLQVMGLDPMEMLIVPRLIGLIITLPLLTFFSDIGLARRR
jgi:hypothetical protein